MYKLRTNSYYPPAVTVVGAGGTGGFVAEGLCRMLAPQVSIILVDHDRVEERNLLRQNFYHDDIGRFKSEALAERLARLYRRPVGWSVTPYGHHFQRHSVYGITGSPIVIGCVDNAQARQGIAESLSSSQWWVDAGNGENWGQVLVGNAERHELRDTFDEKNQVCWRLPFPTIQHPELLSPPPAEEICPMSCAELLDIGDQDPTINQAMAAVVLQVTRRIFMGECSWMALYLDLEKGTLSPVLATPESVSRITGMRVSQLVRK